MIGAMLGVPGFAVAALGKGMQTAQMQSNLEQQEQDAMAFADAHESTGPAAPATQADASVASMFGLTPADIGLTANAPADSTEGSNGVSGESIGPGGDSSGGIGGASGDGPGLKDGGLLAKQSSDPKGIKDSIHVALSGGEQIIPKDVVDMVGPQFFANLITMFHTPAAQQEEEAAEGEV